MSKDMEVSTNSVLSRLWGSSLPNATIEIKREGKELIGRLLSGKKTLSTWVVPFTVEVASEISGYLQSPSLGKLDESSGVVQQRYPIKTVFQAQIPRTRTHEHGKYISKQTNPQPWSNPRPKLSRKKYKKQTSARRAEINKGAEVLLDNYFGIMLEASKKE